jgi:Transposase DDE domain
VSWGGYKAHLTETCDDDLPHLVTDVGTTVAPAQEVDQLGPIQARLATRGLPPAEHLVDTGYVRTSNLVTSELAHQIDLIGPMYDDRRRQAKDPNAFDLAQFQIDWDAQVVTCPNGQRSTGWSQYRTARQEGRRAQIHVQFAPAAGAVCPVRSRCTRAARGPRHLTLRASPDAAASRRVRSAPGRPPAPDHSHLPRPVRRPRRRRGHALARRARLRPAPLPVPRAGQDAPATRRHRDRAEREPAGRLVGWPPPRQEQALRLRGPRVPHLNQLAPREFANRVWL